MRNPPPPRDCLELFHIIWETPTLSFVKKRVIKNNLSRSAGTCDILHKSEMCNNQLAIFFRKKIWLTSAQKKFSTKMNSRISNSVSVLRSVVNFW